MDSEKDGNVCVCAMYCRKAFCSDSALCTCCLTSERCSTVVYTAAEEMHSETLLSSTDLTS